MNRKQTRKWLLTSLLAVSSTTLFAASAQAQVIKGSFTLPCAVHWGAVMLPAGNYTFAAPSSNTPFILTVRNGKKASMIMERGRDTQIGNRSSLQITREGGQAVVSSLQLAPYGLRFEYGKRHPRPAEVASNYPSSKGGPATTKAIAQASVIEIPIRVNGE